MTPIQIDLSPDVRFELAFASVIPGKEAQLFSEYFPAVGPVVADLGGVSLASFVILESAADIETPTIGALFQWPTVAAYQALHEDQRFLALKPVRDDALSQLWNGHFFFVERPISTSIDPTKIYALVVAANDIAVADAELTLAFASESTNQDYADRTLSIAPWSSVTQSLLDGKDKTIEVFKVKFNPAQPAANDGGN